MNATIFGDNIGAALTMERTLDEFDIKITLAPKAVESWFRSRSDSDYEDDITSVNEKYASTFWRGTTDVRSFKPELTRQDTVTTPAGHKLYPSFDNKGNRLMRWFDNNDTNITFKFSAVKYSIDANLNGEYVVIEMWRNTRNTRTGRWSGRLLSKQSFRNPYSELTEQRSTYWMMSKLSRSLNM